MEKNYSGQMFVEAAVIVAVVIIAALLIAQAAMATPQFQILTKALGVH